VAVKVVAFGYAELTAAALASVFPPPGAFHKAGLFPLETGDGLPHETLKPRAILLFLENGDDLVRLRLILLAINTDRPDKFGIIFVEFSLDIIHHRNAATTLSIHAPLGPVRLGGTINHDSAAIFQQ
jgi:hypothetical protein